jgi:hypothetical protein
MKLSELFEGLGGSTFYGKKSSGKGPQWSFQELADEFNLTKQELQSAIKRYPGFPEPTIRHAGTTAAPTRTYYDLKAARKWYKENLAAN